MNTELVENILSFIKKNNFDCYSLNEANSNILIQKLAKSFCFDLTTRYLWESNCIKEKDVYNYDDSSWETILSNLVQNFTDRIYLVLTDDEFYPWKVFNCKRGLVINILKEQQYFEYFIFDDCMRIILFDTHENKFLLAF